MERRKKTKKKKRGPPEIGRGSRYDVPDSERSLSRQTIMGEQPALSHRTSEQDRISKARFDRRYEVGVSGQERDSWERVDPLSLRRGSILPLGATQLSDEQRARQFDAQFQQQQQSL